MLSIEGTRLVYQYDSEIVWLEAWGENCIRVRATKGAHMPQNEGALLSEVEQIDGKPQIQGRVGILQNGVLEARISESGQLRFLNRKGRTLIKEYWRNRRDVRRKDCSALEIEAREWKGNFGGKYHLTYRLESLDREEKLYGMGQYQQPYLNLKGMDLELAHRNSQASIPFLLSSRGYGMLWNNPAIGRAVLGKNIMSFEAYATDCLDYVVIGGDTPAEIEECYARLTGTVPMMPEYGMGFWQCKLRYQTQEEVLQVAREYRRRRLPLDVIVIDYFHWPCQGEWKFDPIYWPDPEAMIEELESMKIKLMVSIWPTVDRESENYTQMLEKGYLIRTERGIRIAMDFEGNTVHYDATNPAARQYVWEKAKENYYDKGIRIFWLDEAEPEYSAYDFDNYRYYEGTNLEVGNLYPLRYAQTFYEGMEAEGQEKIVNLLRCAWAGSQRFGALVWSGDIASSFESMRNQLCAGLNMGLSGIPWWTTDIGGFHGGDPKDPAFQELFARWFAWGAFCPVMRLHGDREPRQEQFGQTGGAHCRSGAPNEVWSYSEEIYTICEKYLQIRESLRDYTRSLMQEAHEKGTPIMRTLFYEFPDDPQCWEIEDAYCYGSDYLIAPICQNGARKRQVYLPAGARWEDWEAGVQYDGGQWIEMSAPLDVIPVLKRID